MLINLSNHPSTNWPAAQIKAASRKYRIVIDIPFPGISPFSSARQIQSKSLKLRSEIVRILKDSKDKTDAVHIMGEMTFVFSLVNLLHKQGITCLASTTKRISEEANGIKISKFSFVRFRKYILPWE